MENKKKNYVFDLDAALEEVAQKLRPSANAECGGSSLPSDAIHTTGVGICSCSCCSKRYFYTAPCQFGCFVAGTKVSTPHGQVAIETIKVGDKVFAYNKEDGKTVIGEVTETFRLQKAIGEILLADGTKINPTTKHPFYLPEHERYVAAKDLKAGDLVMKGFDKKAKAVAVEHVIMKPDFGNAEVFNFTVKKFHNYYVEEVLVHNASQFC